MHELPGDVEAELAMEANARGVVAVAVGRKLDAAVGSRPALNRRDEQTADTATTRGRLDINALNVANGLGGAALRVGSQ